jgi:hypothetical protein
LKTPGLLIKSDFAPDNMLVSRTTDNLITENLLQPNSLGKAKFFFIWDVVIRFDRGRR